MPCSQGLGVSGAVPRRPKGNRCLEQRLRRVLLLLPPEHDGNVAPSNVRAGFIPGPMQATMQQFIKQSNNGDGVSF